MKNFVFTIFTMLFTVFVANGQNNYKCNCKLVYGSKWGLNRITYFNDSLVTKEYALSALDSTGKLLYSNSNKFEDIYQKVNFRWLKADTFLILNNIIGRRIGDFFYPYFPPDSLKKGEKFIRYKKYFDYLFQSETVNAKVFYKIGDTVLNGEQISYFEKEDWSLIIRTSIKEIIQRELNSLPFIKRDKSILPDSLSFFAESNYCTNSNFNCYFCDYTLFKKGETPYKKEKEYNVFFLEGDCENFLKNKPTFLKEFN